MDFEGRANEGCYSNGFIDFTNFESPFDVLAQGYTMSYGMESMMFSDQSLNKMSMECSLMVDEVHHQPLMAMDELSCITGNKGSSSTETMAMNKSIPSRRMVSKIHNRNNLVRGQWTLEEDR